MTQGKIIDRIRKLLRLAKDKGATEGERDNALAMASKMMLEHNVQHVGEEEEIGVIKGQRVHGDMSQKWHHFAIAGIAKLYSCRAVSLSMGKFGWYFVGKPDNVAACELTMAYVLDQIEDLYKHTLKELGRKRGGFDKSERAELRATFKEACAIRLHHRINDIVAQMRGTIPDHMALVVVDQSLSQADDLLKEAGIGKGKEIAPRKIGIGTGAGIMAADTIRLQTEVGRKET